MAAPPCAPTLRPHPGSCWTSLEGLGLKQSLIALQAGKQSYKQNKRQQKKHFPLPECPQSLPWAPGSSTQLWLPRGPVPRSRSWCNIAVNCTAFSFPHFPAVRSPEFVVSWLKCRKLPCYVHCLGQRRGCCLGSQGAQESSGHPLSHLIPLGEGPTAQAAGGRGELG